MVIFRGMVDRIYIWKISNLRCKTSVVWLMAQSNLVSSMHCNDIFLLFAVSQSYYVAFLKRYCFHLLFSYPVHVFTIHACRSLARGGLAQACPNNYIQPIWQLFFVSSPILIYATNSEGPIPHMCTPLRDGPRSNRQMP